MQANANQNKSFHIITLPSFTKETLFVPLNGKCYFAKGRMRKICFSYFLATAIVIPHLLMLN